MTKEHILSEIRRTSLGNQSKPLGRMRFQAETGIKESDWIGKYWARWSEAVTEAGCTPNQMQEAYSSEEILKAFVELIRELKRFPTVPDLRMKSRIDSRFPSQGPFVRLGNKSERARRVIEYCEGHCGLQDVIEICKPLSATAPSVEPVRQGEETYGYVYLLKSGKYFKIGRSICAEKRHYEIQLQLPEELRLVHKIKTDDPVGIEAYWHTRFADKRKRGEWFDLSAEDVRVFRRRNFM